MSSTAQSNRQRGFLTLDQIVRSAIMDIGASMNRYEQFKHFAIEGYRDFHLELAQEVKTVRLPLTAWKSVELPVDYVDWVMIGYEMNNNIQVFLHDERIPLPTIDEDEDGVLDAPVATQATPVEQVPGGVPYYFYNHTKFGEDTGELYGLTTKFNGIGYYKFNPERREIQFDAAINADTTIYLEYISDGYNPTEATVVNVQAAKLVKSYIHMCRHKYAKSSTGQDKKMSEDDYYREFRRVQDRLQPITVADVLECARDGYKLISSF